MVVSKVLWTSGSGGFPSLPGSLGIRDNKAHVWLNGLYEVPRYRTLTKKESLIRTLTATNRSG